MRKDDDEGWTDEVDLDRVRATPGGIGGAWTVVAVLVALILILPPTIDTADTALVGAKQGITKVEYRLAQVVPWLNVRMHRC